MKILMYHTRAGGHNILPFLEYFNEHTEHELHFAYSLDRTYFPEKNRIHYKKIGFSPIEFWNTYKLISSSYDLIWYHGGHSSVILFLFTLLRSKKSTFVFNIWNEWLIQKAKKGGINGYLFSKGVSNSDFVHCNWYGTADILRSTGWAKNIKVFLWGLQKENFVECLKTESNEAQEFINSLSADKIKFFFPKSLSNNSRHDLVIEASKKLIDNGLNNFIVYFWQGNVNDPELLESYQKRISKYGLENNVIIKEHGFLSFGDMQMIWKNMDVGLQIAANEQLSTTFLEPLFYKKEIIVTDILPYRIFNQKFQAEIPLIDLDAESVFRAMKFNIDRNHTDASIKNQRHQIVKDNFNFTENIKKILDHYQKK